MANPGTWDLKYIPSSLGLPGSVNLRTGIYRGHTTGSHPQLTKEYPGTAIMGLISNAGRRGIGMVPTRDNSFDYN